MTGRTRRHRNLRHSTFSTWLDLVFGSWIGLAWASLITAPIGLGFGIAVGSLGGGFWLVPLWGTVWGLCGLAFQRSNAVRRHGITMLKEDDPLAQRVYAMASQLGLKRRPWVGTMSHNNAYAIGASQDSALIVIGKPLLVYLEDAEIDAIIGHELGHVVNNDMRRMGLARSFQSSLVWYLGFSETLQRWARWVITWCSELLVLSLSRKREYWADAIGAALTSKDAMISALEKLHQQPQLSGFEKQNARLMVRGAASRGSLTSTHPTLEQRRRALEKGTYLKRLPDLQTPPAEALAAPTRMPVAADIAYAAETRT